MSRTNSAEIIDTTIQLRDGRTLAAEKLAHCKTTYYPDEGHISLIVNHQEEIVTTLMSEDSRFSLMSDKQ